MFLVFVIRVFLGTIFLPSALSKLRRYAQFEEAIQSYGILPKPLARIYALFLPWIELTIGLLFLGGFALRIATTVTFLLLMSFVVALVINLRANRVQKCHCYGVLGNTDINWGTVIRNVFLAMLTIILFGITPSGLSLSNWLDNWQHDLLLLSSFDSLVLVGLLLTFSFVVLVLSERALSLNRRDL